MGHIDQKTAVSLLKEAAQKFGFAHLRTAHGEEAWNIFHHQRGFDRVTKGQSVRTETLKKLFGVERWEHIIERPRVILCVKTLKVLCYPGRVITMLELPSAFQGEVT